MAQKIQIKTAQDSSLKLSRMRAIERLGEPFRFHVDMLSQKDDVNLKSLLGTKMTVEASIDSGYKRYFDGIVAEASQTGYEVIDEVRYAVYHALVVPKPWLLMRKSDCRIYSNKSVPDIVKEVLSDLGYGDVKSKLTHSYQAREYCVQYRESHFNFISRLMQEEGIYYYFEHSDSTHSMVLADSLSAHAAVNGYASLPYVPPLQVGKHGQAAVLAWESARDINSASCQLIDYDPMNPRASLLVTEKASNAGDTYSDSDLTRFDYPGLYDKSTVGKHYAQVRIEADNALQHRYKGQSDALGLSTGALFTLKDAPLHADNQEYLVVGSEIRLAAPALVSGDDEDIEPFECSFEAITSKQPFRNRLTARRPIIAGLQTAVVAGDKAEDIDVDKEGRVKVTFFWNQEGKPNAQNSCPVRVASTWAGKNWGAIQIPRVGQEVVVSFLEGNPDRPLIIGSVYNADNMPPYALPDNKTQSGVKSRSEGGGPSQFNELRFEDKRDKEEIYIHAQKDKREEILNDHIVTIDHDHKATVKNDQTVEVQGNDTLTVKKDQKGTIEGARTFTITKNDTIKSNEKIVLEAGQEIELKTGAASIVMKSSGEIAIKGMKISITGSAQGVDISGVKVGIKADAELQASAGGMMKLGSDGMMQIQGQAMTEVKGAMLMLSGSGMTQISGGITMIG